MWIEIDVFIRNFTKWVEISVNIRNFTKWIDNCNPLCKISNKHINFNPFQSDYSNRKD